MIIENEIWKEVDDFNGLYEISNFGRLKSLSRRINLHRGGYHYTKERILRTDSKARKYPFVVLCNGNFKKQYYIHRLVACAFIPNPENKAEVNHINGNKKDNRVSNLEWCTHHENMLHANEKGLKKRYYGTDNKLSKLTENEVLEIRHLYSKKIKNTVELSKIYKVSNSRISDIINNKIYTNFTPDIKLKSLEASKTRVVVKNENK